MRNPTKEQGNIPPKPDNAVRIVCISDTHTRHRGLVALPLGDILIHAGDFTMSGEGEPLLDFLTYLNSQPHKHKIVISGNHDTVMAPGWYQEHYWRFHSSPESALQLKEEVKKRVIYLEDEEVQIEGLRIYGSPWTVEYHDWVFMAQQKELKKIWELIPLGIDVLITHGPPKFEEEEDAKIKDDDKVGDVELGNVVRNVKPALHIFGHVHHRYGLQKFNKMSGTVFVNASSVTKKYKPNHFPIVIDVF